MATGILLPSTALIERLRNSIINGRSTFSHEQKGVYMQLLQNPYNSNIDIGFVFILYYGLERHLLYGDYERASKVILKLRDVHSNKSFQSYSANALVLVSMLHQKGEIAFDFIQSLDKDYEYLFSDTLFLLCYFSFQIPLGAQDIMRMAKTFEFTNLNYIKKFPELFQVELENEIIKKTGEKVILIAKYFNKTDIAKLSTQEIPVFANLSIRDKAFSVPLLSENFKFKKELNMLLESAHAQVKQNVANMKKAGTLLIEKKEIKQKLLPAFNEREEKDLLEVLNSAGDNLECKHFAYIGLQNFYYKYRDLNEKYINKCIEYCVKQIEIASAVAKIMQEENLKQINEMIEMEKKYGTGDGSDLIPQNLPSHTGYKQLAVIEKKNKNWKRVIELCEQAKSEGWTDDWDKRITEARKHLNEYRALDESQMRIG